MPTTPAAAAAADDSPDLVALAIALIDAHLDSPCPHVRLRVARAALAMTSSTAIVRPLTLELAIDTMLAATPMATRDQLDDQVAQLREMTTDRGRLDVIARQPDLIKRLREVIDNIGAEPSASAEPADSNADDDWSAAGDVHDPAGIALARDPIMDDMDYVCDVADAIIPVLRCGLIHSGWLIEAGLSQAECGAAWAVAASAIYDQRVAAHVDPVHTIDDLSSVNFYPGPDFFAGHGSTAARAAYYDTLERDALCGFSNVLHSESKGMLLGLDLRCRRWNGCPRCRAKNKDGWLRWLPELWGQLGIGTIFVATLDGQAARKVAKKLRRADVRLRVVSSPGGRLTILSAVAFAGSRELSGAELAAELALVIEHIPERIGRPITGSRSWGLLRRVCDCCRGSGCDTCRGKHCDARTGRRHPDCPAHKCPDCQGSKHANSPAVPEKCAECEGAGKLKARHTGACQDRGFRDKAGATCPGCKRCTTCRGRGTKLCGTCLGDGHLSCEKCKGLGTIKVPSDFQRIPGGTCLGDHGAAKLYDAMAAAKMNPFLPPKLASAPGTAIEYAVAAKCSLSDAVTLVGRLVAKRTGERCGSQEPDCSSISYSEVDEKTLSPAERALRDRIQAEDILAQIRGGAPP